MDEGKPTRAKWWSLPRPQYSPSGQSPSGQSPSGQSPSGSPADRADDMTAEPASPVPDRADGDFELARPNPAPSALDAPGEPAAAAPGPETTASAAAPARDGEVVDDGEYELSRPATPREPSVAQRTEGPEGPRAAGDRESTEDPKGVEGVEGAAGGAIAGTAGSAGLGGGTDATSVMGERRVGPLHDPDPYSTPPYGEPGPWAPAPPVQHPAVSPVPVPVPVPRAEPGAPAPGADVTSRTDVRPAGPETPPGPTPLGLLTPSPSPADPGRRYHPWQRYDPWSAAPFAGPAGPAGPAGAESVGESRRDRQGRRKLIGGALAVALVSGGFGGAVGTYLERNGGLRPIQLPQASAEPTGRAADGVAGIAARALPGVVTLHVTGGDESGTGTGFVLDSRGYILTNNHVVESAKSGGAISVVFDGGQTVQAEVVGRDSGYDLAVVRVTGVKGLKPLYLGNSDDVRVGDPVVAIGAPFDLEGTVTSGIISARERPVIAGGGSGDASDVSYVDALQTDAPINPGNSGGPLLDARGRVIGVNSAIRSGADSADAPDAPDAPDAKGGSIGLGFAIPINQGKRVAEELINTGRATHPVIGVSLDMDYAGDGAHVSATGADGNAAVTPGGPGDRAGIRAGDVITEVDGRRVHTGGELIVRTRAHRPGDRLELTVERAGRERTLTLVLGSSGGG